MQRVKPVAVLPVSNCVCLCRRRVFQWQQEMKRSLKQVNVSRQKWKCFSEEAPVLANRVQHQSERPNVPCCRGESDHGSFPSRSLTARMSATKRWFVGDNEASKWLKEVSVWVCLVSATRHIHFICRMRNGGGWGGGAFWVVGVYRNCHKQYIRRYIPCWTNNTEQSPSKAASSSNLSCAIPVVYVLTFRNRASYI
jgi:hypothetical protein